MNSPDLSHSALLLVDLQNDFIHPSGAYARGGARSEHIAALPARIAPLVAAMRAANGWVVSTHFTLVPGKDRQPLISPHLKRLRPFLGRGDFVPGSFGHALLDELAPADLMVEKVAFSAFFMSRLEFVLRKAGIDHLWVTGIVTNGGVASTVRDAHVRDIGVTIIRDACAAFDPAVHDATLTSLASIAHMTTVAEAQELFTSAAKERATMSDTHV